MRRCAQGKVRQLGISNNYDLASFRAIFDEADIKPSVLQNRRAGHRGEGRAGGPGRAAGAAPRRRPRSPRVLQHPPDDGRYTDTRSSSRRKSHHPSHRRSHRRSHRPSHHPSRLPSHRLSRSQGAACCFLRTRRKAGRGRRAVCWRVRACMGAGRGGTGRGGTGRGGAEWAPGRLLLSSWYRSRHSLTRSACVPPRVSTHVSPPNSG